MVLISEERSFSKEAIERALSVAAASNNFDEFEGMDLLKAMQEVSSGTTMRIKLTYEGIWLS